MTRTCYDCHAAPATVARDYGDGQGPGPARCEPCDRDHVRALKYACSNPDPGRRVRL